jgi:hypothetical protein
MKLVLITLVAVVVGVMVGCGGSSEYREITWDEAVDLIKDRIAATPHRDSNSLPAMLPFAAPFNAKEIQPAGEDNQQIWLVTWTVKYKNSIDWVDRPVSAGDLATYEWEIKVGLAGENPRIHRQDRTLNWSFEPRKTGKSIECPDWKLGPGT